MVRNPGVILIKAETITAKTLYDHLNHYAGIVNSDFVKRWLPLPMNIGVINITGTKYILYEHDTPTSNDNARAIKQLIGWLKEQQCPYTIDDLYQIYRISVDGSGNALSERAFNKMLSANAVDITYNSKDTYERKSVEGGETLVKSCFKVSSTVCYYVYTGVIPEGTRDPWSRKKK